MIRALLVAMAFAVAGQAAAQQAGPRSLEELNLSYVYAPIFGTGIYQAGAEQTTVVKLSAHALLLDQGADSEWYWLLPVTAGVRRAELTGVVGDVLDGELHDMTFMPGVARRYRPAPRWVVSPSVQLGVAHDFTLHTSRTLLTTAVRSTNWWYSGRQRWTWGNRVRLAGQNKLFEGRQQGFFLLETGLEWDTPTSLQLAGSPLHFSLYGFAQHFIENTGIKNVEGERIGTQNLLNLGFTLGWDQPVSYMGLSLGRVGMTFVAGENVRALTLNLGFPLADD